MRVAGADDPVAANVVVFAGKKSADVARGNSQIAQHHRHGRGKIFAMSGAACEKEISERIGGTRAGEIQRVAVMRFQIQLDLGGLVVFVGRASGDLFGELLDARIQARHLEIIRCDRIGKIRGGQAQLRRRDPGEVGSGLVTDFSVVVERIRERAGLIENQVAVRFALPMRSASVEKRPCRASMRGATKIASVAIGSINTV